MTTSSKIQNNNYSNNIPTAEPIYNSPSAPVEPIYSSPSAPVLSASTTTGAVPAAASGTTGTGTTGTGTTTTTYVNNTPTPPTTTTSSPPQPSPAPPAVGGIENPRYVHVGGTRDPATLNYCPRCGKEHIVTQTKTKPTGATWVGCLIGFFIFWPLCWIPFVCNPMKQTNHYCPNCKSKVGRVKAFQF